MGKSALFAASLFALVVLVSASSHGDVATSPSPRPTLPAAAATPEPITGTAAMPVAGSETIVKDPFALYEPGPPGTKTWTYSELSPAEKAWVDKNANAAGWDQIHAGWASAVRERTTQAAAEAAAHQLGIVDPLATTGVVP